VDAEAIAWAWGRLALAVVCVAALMAARWRHERQLAQDGREMRDLRTWLERQPADGGAGLGYGGMLERLERLGRHAPSVSHPLYWLGLTTSAALAAQSISVLVAG
jgi:hypothetical protein